MTHVRTRKDIASLSQIEKDNLIRAFKGIQDKTIDDDRSFFKIGGLHGQPFHGAGYTNKNYWGGYCHHGNVLFPTWHRAYLLHLEEALRTISGCGDVTLPYWNQMNDNVPAIFLTKKYTLDGKEIDNPLYSYKLQQGFFDNLARTVGPNSQKVDYSKYKNYKTVRYPYSGLVGPGDRERTEAYNSLIEKLGDQTVNGMLNTRVNTWLIGTSRAMRERYKQSLLAPNYTVFSNTTSAAKYNDDHFSRPGEPDSGSGIHVVSLESPHNGMHLAVGGYSMDDSEDPGALESNGDMGENDTAGFDPIFYFHHCFVDLVFWSWQMHNGTMDKLEVTAEYPGTSSIDGQGPTPGTAGDSWLTMKTPLHPFKKAESQDPLTSLDVANITKLYYNYDHVVPKPSKRVSDAQMTPILRVSGIDRSHIAGSFVISIWASADTPESDTPESDTLQSDAPQSDREWLVGVEPVFSRWHVSGCANCQNSLTVTTHVPVISPTDNFSPLPLPLPYEKAKLLKYEVRLSAKALKRSDSVVFQPHQELGSMLHYF